MTSTVLMAFCLVVAMAMIFYFAWRYAYGKLQDERLKNAVLERSVRQLESENGKLREEMKLKSRLEKETNEKIDSLHTGDSVANAVNGLSKPKNSDG